MMTPEVHVNHTRVDDMSLCYVIDEASFMPTNTPSTECVLLYIFLSLSSVVTVCGNLLVIISIIYFKQLHTPTNSLILSLAMADLLVGLLVFPLSMKVTWTACLFYQNILCKVRTNFDVTMSTASILNLCCISIDRYYAVCQPLTYRTKINAHVVMVMILFVWGVSVLAAVGFIIAGLNFEKCGEKCFLDVVLAIILSSLLSFYVPVLIMLCIYLKIFLVAQRQVRSIQNVMKSGAAVSKMERKSTKTLAIVLGVFLVCWLPFFLCNTAETSVYVSVPPVVYEALGWLGLFNSMLNPFIYAFFYSWFRSAFRIIMSGKVFLGNFANAKLL
ncbi:trace amine-associated receptor 1-like [Pholidichthys leucotaenia]